MTTIINEIHKFELVNKETHYEVTTYELMGSRWVALGEADLWTIEEAEEFIND